MAPMYNDLIIIQKETGNVNRNFDFQMQREKSDGTVLYKLAP